MDVQKVSLINLKKIVLSLTGGALIGIGAGTILYAGIGGDTVTVFQDGLHELKKSNGIIDGTLSGGIYKNYFSNSEIPSRIYNVVFVVLALMFARKYSGIGTVLSALVIGYAIDISNALWLLTMLNTGFITGLIIFLIGLVIYAMGIALLIKCDAGMNCLDALLYRLMDVTGLKYKYLRIAADVILTVTGCLMGGVFGVGTVIAVFLTGPLVELFTGNGQ